MKYCPKCSTWLEDDAIICTKCGKRIRVPKKGKIQVFKVEPDSAFDIKKEPVVSFDLGTTPKPKLQKPITLPKRTTEDKVPPRKTEEKQSTQKKEEAKRVPTIYRSTTAENKKVIPKSQPKDHIEKTQERKVTKANYDKLGVLGVISIGLAVIAFFLSCQFVAATAIVAVIACILGIICACFLPKDSKGYIGIVLSVISIALTFFSQYQR